MRIQNNQFPSIDQLRDQYLNNKNVNTKSESADELSFQEILSQKQLRQTGDAAVKFSKHASARLSDRNIELSSEQLERLNAGTEKASGKGINESLVLVDDLAFIVNTKSKTVVTAMDQSETKENIFTNIDGAVII